MSFFSHLGIVRCSVGAAAWLVLCGVPAAGQMLTTVAGIPGTRQPSADYRPLPDNTHATARPLYDPLGVAADLQGNVYFSDYDKTVDAPGYNKGRVYKVSVSGTITTVAGNGTATCSGDGGPATAAGLVRPRGLALNKAGTALYIAEQGSRRVRKVDLTSGIITTVAGTGSGKPADAADNVPATSSAVPAPMSVALDKAGNLYISDEQLHSVRRVDATTQIITTVAGTAGQSGFDGDDGPATTAHLKGPRGLTVAPNGDLYVADYGNNVIRKVTVRSGRITTVAGTPVTERPSNGPNGDGLPATNAQVRLVAPCAVAVDRKGSLYIVEFNKIRKVSADKGIITTYAGTGSGKSEIAGNGLLPTAGKIQPGVLCQVGDKLYLADTGTYSVRVVLDKVGF